MMSNVHCRVDTESDGHNGNLQRSSSWRLQTLDSVWTLLPRGLPALEMLNQNTRQGGGGLLEVLIGATLEGGVKAVPQTPVCAFEI
jgi:hypothetical protein